MTDLSQTFGYQSVDETERERRIRRVFAAVARRYDLMNDLMSLGIHRLWKRRLARLAAPAPGQVIVDLAGGTGDVAALMAGADRRVLVCVHGLSRQGRDFDTLAADLCQHYRVVCPDVVGRGQRPRRQVRAGGHFGRF
mgnify:CR=1 FL=1